MQPAAYDLAIFCGATLPLDVTLPLDLTGGSALWRAWRDDGALLFTWSTAGGQLTASAPSAQLTHLSGSIAPAATQALWRDDLPRYTKGQNFDAGRHLLITTSAGGEVTPWLSGRLVLSPGAPS
jgi:hypothetical protein